MMRALLMLFGALSFLAPWIAFGLSTNWRYDEGDFWRWYAGLTLHQMLTMTGMLSFGMLLLNFAVIVKLP